LLGFTAAANPTGAAYGRFCSVTKANLPDFSRVFSFSCAVAKQGELKVYEESFDSRVQAVDNKYRDRISDLNAQINELRLVNSMQPCYRLIAGLFFICLLLFNSSVLTV
jgi:hypothetical protein